jgi:hypothetical protein
LRGPWHRGGRARRWLVTRFPSSWSRARGEGSESFRTSRGRREGSEDAVVSGETNVPPTVEGVGAVTLVTRDMARAVRSYRALGLTIRHGGKPSTFTSLHAGPGYQDPSSRPADHHRSWWGRVIFHVSDVGAFHALAVATGLGPDTAPADDPGASASST